VLPQPIRAAPRRALLGSYQFNPGLARPARAALPVDALERAGYRGEQGYRSHRPTNHGQGQYPPAGGLVSQPQERPYDPNAAYGAPPQGYSPQQYGQPGYPHVIPVSRAPVRRSRRATRQRLWATLANISIPFIGFIGPLIVYLIYKDRDQFLKEASTEALNFSILYTAASVISSILVVAFIGAILWPLVFIAGLVFCIMAAIASNKHELYRYPVNWRLIK
jgi:uncharacterized Tic20 family protein